MKSKIKDILVRAGKTFWQAALASVAISIPEMIDLIPVGWVALKPLLVSAGVGALAAGLSAVWNGVIAPIIKLMNSNTETAVIEAKANGGESPVDKGE